MDTAPSETLYINNINEKVKKNVLKKMLYMLFSQYGKIIDIVACKGLKRRGQAWVVFRDITSATNALRGKQGFNFYDKPLKIAFAKNKSKALLKPGAAVSSSKRAREDDGDSDIPSKEARLGGIGKTIIARNLPEDCTPQMLTMLFQQHPGFVDVRIAPGNKGVAFIDFEQDVQGSMAVKQLNGFQLTSSSSLQLELS